MRNDLNVKSFGQDLKNKVKASVEKYVRKIDPGNELDIKNWEQRLKDQKKRAWSHYGHLHIDLNTAMADQSYLFPGEYIYVEESSSAAAVAKIKLDRLDNEFLDLEKGVEIETVFSEIFITNDALEGEWIDLVFGINFKYKKKIAKALTAAICCFDIRDYGAIEDGSTDASVAVQAAIDAAEQDAVIDRGRGVLLIPCVTGLGYICADDIQLKNQIIITGGGMIKFTSTYGFESDGKSGWVIDGITILGSDTAGQTGVYIHNSSVKVWIRNCQFYGLQTGIFATKSYFIRIDDNDMYLASIPNITCIKLTSGEGNCSKGTVYDTVKAVKIRGNMLKVYAIAPSAKPLIWIGDSAFAPISPQLITHGVSIDISANGLTGKPLSTNGVRAENTKMLTIERNWFESFVGPAVYLAGQWHFIPVIRANGIWGNDDDDYMDPAIKLDSTINWNANNLTIAQNEFNKIHANHNYLELDNAVGLVIDNNRSLTADRIVLTNCTGVDIRQPNWTHIFDTFTVADATPSVKYRPLYNTDAGGLTITAFDDGIVGQEVKIISKGAVVFDTTTANDATHNLDGSSVNITTAAGDYTRWVYDGTSWTLQAFVDISADNSGGA